MFALRSTLFCLATLGAARAAPELRQPIAAATLEQLPQQWHEDSGRPLVLATLRGQRIVLTMAYASCHRFCPASIDALQRMQQRSDARAEALTFLIVSYDPANDTPAVWREYRSKRHLDRTNWHFLTGSVAATRQLAHQLGFPFWIYDEHVMHESRAVIFDAQGLQQAALGSNVSRWSDTL